MIWFWLVIIWVFLFFTMYMSLEHFGKHDLRLGFYWGFFALVFLALTFIVLDKAMSDGSHCKTYYERIGKSGEATITLCDRQEIQFNGKTYRGPG